MMELHEAINLFLGQYTNPNTIRAYNPIFNALTDSVGRSRDIELISPADLLSFVNKRRQRTKSPFTLYKDVKALRALFNMLVRLKELKESPMTGISAPRPRKPVDEDKAATEEEIGKILNVLYGHPRDYALALFLADTGCRAGGVATLTLSNLHLDDLLAVVHEKFEMTYTVWIGHTCAAAMRQWLVMRPLVGHDHVFCSHKFPHEPLTVPAIAQIIRRASKRVPGGRSLGPHSFRHRKAISMLQQGNDVLAVAKVLNHKDPKITMDFYLRATQEAAAHASQSTHFEEEDAPRILRFPKAK